MYFKMFLYIYIFICFLFLDNLFSQQPSTPCKNERYLQPNNNQWFYDFYIFDVSMTEIFIKAILNK